MNGSLIFAGLFPIHYAPQNNSTLKQCQGKFNTRGFEQALAMLYALEQINNDSKILPGIPIGADIKDTCSSVDSAIRKCLNFSFVRNNMEDMMCEKTLHPDVVHDPRTVAIVGLGSTDVAMAVANFAGLFYVPVVSYSSSSRLLSNRIRFKYFLRTISSDTLMARAVIDFLRELKWNFVHVLYSDTDYGRSAFETFDHVLSASTGAKICLAIKRAFTQQSKSRDIVSFLGKMQENENAKAKAVLLFTTVGDTEFILSHFDKLNMTDYVFIATDHFTGRLNRFNSSPQMLRRIVGVVPRKGRTKDFEDFFQKVLETGKLKQFPWFHEFKKCYLKPPLELSTYVPYVIDAVYATAHGLHNLLNCTQARSCRYSTDEFPSLNRNDGFLKSIQNVKFPGLSRDQVSFDADGNGLGAYDITVVNTETEQWETIGNWISNTSKVVDLPVNESFLELNLTKLRTLWRKVFNSTVEPTSFCGQQCPPGHWMILDERYQSCCWKCAPCSTNEISHNPVNGSCKRCPPRYWPNANRTGCLPIIPTTIKLSDPAGISVGVVAALGALCMLSITIVFLRHGHSHVVRASSKVLSYIMLFGISLGYLTAALILLERTKTLCQVVLFLFSIGFCIVVGTLLIKTNRIHRIFSKNAMRKGTPPCLSDRWMVAFILGFVLIEIVICVILVFTNDHFTEVVYTDMKNEAFIQCKFASFDNYNIALWWGFNCGLVLICTYQAFLTRKVPGNYNEARFIAFNMMTISTDLLMFFLSYYGTKTYYKDILVSAFLIVADTVTITCMFLPKVYVIVFRPQKNVDSRSTVSLGTIDADEDEGQPDRKISTRSNTSLLSSPSNLSGSQMETRNNSNNHENNVESTNRKISSALTNGNLHKSWSSDGCSERPEVESRDSSLSVRTVRFEDEIDSDLMPDSPTFHDSLPEEFDYRRRESTI
ncbi:Metabotropic glutamate receptor 4 [Stylophora pistillata]|uniref:Metabotropic glutamate receptor 4 n=2 Tax=Stylophora pistillata TaxID=50429 RepID=A0A2B4RYX6_STYPI|nr:Metabotropic glutamate receptor 4 [Stylophora pistillata]